MTDEAGKGPVNPVIPVETDAEDTTFPGAPEGAPGPAGFDTEVPRERGLGDLVRRAVSAGFEAASRSKHEVVRVATTEVRNWLDRMDLDEELMKALSKMVIEVKSEIRFRPTEDGKMVAETVNETNIKSGR